MKKSKAYLRLRCDLMYVVIFSQYTILSNARRVRYVRYVNTECSDTKSVRIGQFIAKIWLFFELDLKFDKHMEKHPLC